ncbi:permease prefix domain 1-containing protein [Streptomyces antimycoticus]|uniref:permease prefix domain 1-containing protein n=1 Tax=Streptomyces antimycoticus TaxID=68175 RepID=UPI002570371D|nr:permease prefix domain 1-containing protein [Streptomyces antimycoticus]WJE01397.1 permease prefix domain 1-containing protein [Streptomyces antimycoticus]
MSAHGRQSDPVKGHTVGAHPAEADPVEEYIADLTALLRGPARAKARMIEEIRDGLTETVATHTRGGSAPGRAADDAVREFGTPEELAPVCQRELTIAQARHTAWALALTAPFLAACWYLTWSTAHGQDGLVPRAAQLLVTQLAAVIGAMALLAAPALAVTGALARRLPTPDRLPLTIAWVGTTAGVAMGIATLTLAVASLVATDWPLLALAGAFAAVSHAVVAPSARACRRCARPAFASPPSPGGVVGH